MASNPIVTPISRFLLKASSIEAMGVIPIDFLRSSVCPVRYSARRPHPGDLTRDRSTSSWERTWSSSSRSSWLSIRASYGDNIPRRCLLLQHTLFHRLDFELLNVLDPCELGNIREDLPKIELHHDLGRNCHLRQELTPHVHLCEAIDREGAIDGQIVVHPLDVARLDVDVLLRS